MQTYSLTYSMRTEAECGLELGAGVHCTLTLTLSCRLCRYYITAGMQAGMVVSNEPGYYEEGAFGIRIENLVTAREADTPFKFGDVPYLSFERLTQVPFQRKLMDLQVCFTSAIDQQAISTGCLHPGCPMH